MACYSNGTTLFWHTTSKTILHRYEDSENPLNTIDINYDASKFATGGTDTEVKLYDVGKKSPPTILEGTPTAPKHSNRIYALKFLKNDPNILLSAGWDNVIIIYILIKLILIHDLRMGHTAGFIFGPKVYSESLDIKDNIILTGSFREKR